MNRAFTKRSPLVHPQLTAHSFKMEKDVYQIGACVYLAVGFGLGSPCMVVGEDGVIIIDPNEDVGKCEEVLGEFRKRTKKPIKAVVFTHWHGDHWRGVRGFVQPDEVASGQVQIIAHDRFLWNVTWAHTSGLGPLMNRRNNYTFGDSLELGEEGRVNNGIGPDVLINQSSFIPPTRTFSHELDVVLCGIQFHMRHVPSETD
ncbi:MAG: MBL fold metallo-hydrolase, partial [Desulfovibrio sp.]|nr:MBL fold metallo-hydrolase [Desulfovibrio sp.]